MKNSRVYRILGIIFCSISLCVMGCILGRILEYDFVLETIISFMLALFFWGKEYQLKEERKWNEADEEQRAIIRNREEEMINKCVKISRKIGGYGLGIIIILSIVVLILVLL